MIQWSFLFLNIVHSTANCWIIRTIIDRSNGCNHWTFIIKIFETYIPNQSCIHIIYREKNFNWGNTGSGFTSCFKLWFHEIFVVYKKILHCRVVSISQNFCFNNNNKLIHYFCNKIIVELHNNFGVNILFSTYLLPPKVQARIY